MKADLLLGTVLAVATLSAAEGGIPQTQAARKAAMEWLQKAEEVAWKIDNTPREAFPPNLRQHAFSMIAMTCMEVGEFDRAKQIAAKLPEEDKQRVLNLMPAMFAYLGRYEEGIREAKAMGKPVLAHQVVSICAQTDAKKALELIDQVPAEAWSRVYAAIAKQQILSGDMDGARASIDKVSDREYREEPLLLLSAGLLVAIGGDIRQVAEKIKIDLDESQGALLELLEAAAKAGDMDKAERILAVLAGPNRQSRGLIAIAEGHLGRSKTDAALKAIAGALEETNSIDAGDGLSALTKATRYTHIAMLQAKAGRVDDAVKTVQLADAARKKEAKEGLGVFDALGGKVALVGLLVGADKLDEAAKMARKEDGTLVLDAVPALVEAYEAKGRFKEAQDILFGIPESERGYWLYLSAARGAWQGSKNKQK